MNKIIVAIDGVSSSGKSTLAKQLAKELQYVYLDTGAMYRSVTWYALQHKLLLDDEINKTALEAAMPTIKIQFEYDADNKLQTILNGQNIEKEIRGIWVSDHVSQISELRFVRERMVALQQQMSIQKGIVMDGRDIGTVVFPDAELKIFVTASPAIRAQRRFDELVGKGENVSFDQIKTNIEKRDFIDSNRKESPLTQASDAILLDNSNLTRKEQFDWLLNKVNEKL